MKLPVGTRTLLYGVHCVPLHTFWVALAWTRLYGFPWDPRLWASFLLHDLGYWGLDNLDGPEGERHVLWGANLMGRLFGEEWRIFTLSHSRFWAQAIGAPISRLCVADKLSCVLEPRWSYLLRARASGELWEYMSRAGTKYTGMGVDVSSVNAWHEAVMTYLRAWVEEHKDCRPDLWTRRDQ